MPTCSQFPSVSIGGPRPLKLVVREQEYPTGSLVFEDGGIETNITSPCGRMEMDLTYDGLSQAEAQLLDDHFDEAKKDVNDFLFLDYHSGRLLAGCKYVSYRKPQHTKHWSGKRQITLVKEPT